MWKAGLSISNESEEVRLYTCMNEVYAKITWEFGKPIRLWVDGDMLNEWCIFKRLSIAAAFPGSFFN